MFFEKSHMDELLLC